MSFQLRTVAVVLGTLAVAGVPCPVAAQEVGFVISTPADGSAMAAGSALFAYRNANGVLVSEAGVGAAQPVAAGRMFVEEDQDGTRTAVGSPTRDLRLQPRRWSCETPTESRSTRCHSRSPPLAIRPASYRNCFPAYQTGSSERSHSPATFP